MNLTEQRINGNDQIHLTDALNASLLEVKLTKTASTISADTSDLKIYVDKQDKTNPSTERREYVFSLDCILASYTDSSAVLHSDEFSIKMVVENNDIMMKTNVVRKISTDENGNSHLLTENVIEELDTFPIILFEGTNYIYTNYTGIDIEIVYPKNTDENRMLLNTAMYYTRKMKSSTDFSLDDIYFKDAFTKTEDKLNFEIDSINAACITSKNNKFSLDSEGNLVVNSISTLQEGNNQSVLDLVYPVGSIYLSVNTTNPATLFGGIWEQLKDKFLLGAGDTYTNASTGGEATHLLTADESGLRSHNHLIGRDNDAAFGSINGSVHANGNYTDSTAGANWLLYTSTVGSQNANIAHNNMPPYLTICMWKRVS